VCTSRVNLRLAIPENEITGIWNKVNYNFICNQRYYQSQNERYLKALDLRLLYSVIELITSYFTFRQIPWRGEKRAIGYLEANEPVFYRQFQNFLISHDIDERMKFYGKMFDLTIPESLGRWDKDIVIGESQDESSYGREQAKKFWSELIKAS